MSVTSEVQRTLVKSPPELWAELSDPAILARHLGELGEIRIVQTEPDRAVDWEAAATNGAQASGRVEIEPSGWGTKVTLSASRAIVEPAPEAEAIEVIAEPEAEAIEVIAEPEPEIIEPEPEPEPEAIETVPGVPEVEPQPEPEIVDPKAYPRFFARLFRRRRNRTSPESVPTVEPETEPVAVVEIEEPLPREPAPEETVSAAPTTVAPTPEPDISAELAELEERTTAVLTGVLDRLGAAHHRPFSRS
jgi:hypothetical protein